MHQNLPKWHSQKAAEVKSKCKSSDIRVQTLTGFYEMLHTPSGVLHMVTQSQPLYYIGVIINQY